MKITCSHCKSQYLINGSEIKKLYQSIFTCKKCSRYIKIAFCRHCSALYSITFSASENHNYVFQCFKCSKAFSIEIPFVKQNEGFIRANKKLQQNMPDKPVIRKREHRKTDGNKDKHSPDSTITPRGAILSSFNLQEFFSIAFSALTGAKLRVSIFGILTIISMLFLFYRIENLIHKSAIVRDSQFASSFFSLLPVAIAFIIFILTSAIISRITMEKILFNSKWTIVKSFHFMKRIIFPVFISNIFILIIANAIIILFAKIPIVGPVFFSLLFLPVYLISLLILIIICIGFWFYPPVIAHHKTGVIKNFKNLFLFTKKHNLSLIYIILLLVVITTVIFTAIRFIHFSSVSLVIFLSKNILANEIKILFSAIPSNLLRISELSFFGTEIIYFKSLIGELLISHQIGGFIIGIIFSIFSVLLYASFISIIGTVSTHVYIAMERNRTIDDWKKMKPLLILALILLIIFLFKRIFF